MRQNIVTFRYPLNKYVFYGTQSKNRLDDGNLLGHGLEPTEFSENSCWELSGGLEGTEGILLSTWFAKVEDVSRLEVVWTSGGPSKCAQCK